MQAGFRGTPDNVKIIMLAAAALTGAPPPNQIPTAQPTAKWVVDFATDHCTASRAFTANGLDLIFAIQPLAMRDGARVMIQMPRKITSWVSENAAISIASSRLERTGAVMAEPVVRPGYSRYVIGLNREDYEKLLTAHQMTFDGQHLRAQFDLGSLASLTKVLDQCKSTLLASWGLPVEAQTNLASFPKPNDGAAIFSPNDYPNGAANRGAIGEVWALTNVDSSGRVTGCRIIRSSGHADLDAATCTSIRKRARFAPALDKAGKPMASPYIFTTRWQTFAF